MIVDIMARTAAQHAIMGKTLAGTKVLNSPMASIKGIVDASPHFSPVVVVTSSESETTVTGQDTQGGETKASISLTVFVPPSARVTLDGRVYEVESNGAFASFLSDIIIAQALQALRDYENPWARLWSRVAVNIHKIKKGPPYLEVDDTFAVPSRLLTIEYQPLADPVAGRPMTATFQDFHDLMLADSGLRVLAPMFKSSIEDPSGAPDWAYIIMQLGLADAAATNTGIRPLEPAGEPLSQAGAYEEDPDDDGEIILPTDNEGAP
ncbi:MAG: hypothetical protein ACK4MV_16510 [Beijerinckiaceae bacterium]